MRFSLQYTLLLYPVLSNAAPNQARNSVGVTATQLTSLELFSQYAAAAYCYSSINSAIGATINCSAEGGTCPLVESARPTLLSGFSTSDSTQGFVALDNTNELIVVSFQGTTTGQNIIDFFTDLDIIQTETTLCGSKNTHDGCRVHDGFLKAMQESTTIVAPIIASAILAHPTYQIVTTGHSLGAAIAALLGTQLRNSGYTVDIYTFGQPHVGNADINNHIQSQAPSQGNNYRVTHTNDVVPQLPPHDWVPAWDHYYPELWVDTNTVPVPSSSIKNVTGSLYETSGNEGDTSGWGLLVDVIEGYSAHYKYFGPIDGCTSTAPKL